MYFHFWIEDSFCFRRCHWQHFRMNCPNTSLFPKMVSYWYKKIACISLSKTRSIFASRNGLNLHMYSTGIKSVFTQGGRIVFRYASIYLFIYSLLYSSIRPGSWWFSWIHLPQKLDQNARRKPSFSFKTNHLGYQISISIKSIERILSFNTTRWTKLMRQLHLFTRRVATLFRPFSCISLA